jgi:nitrite reductase/ring-hydroxylating ferredoxin subunit
VKDHREEGDVNWTKVLPQEELPDGGRHIVDVGGQAILLLRVRGQLYAIDNKCPHMGASLKEAEVTEEDTLICPRHRSVFELRTGKVKVWAPWPPGIGRVLGSMSREKPLPVYPTRIEQGSIWVGTEASG